MSHLLNDPPDTPDPTNRPHDRNGQFEILKTRGALRFLGFILLAIAAPVNSLIAQQDLPVSPGDRVRVSVPDERAVGIVTSIRADSLVLNVESREAPLALAFASLTKLEVSRGQKAQTGQGALIGMGVGAAVGAILAVSICSDGNCTESTSSDDQSGLALAAAVVLGVGAVALGAGIGALIGSNSKIERWETIPLSRLRLSPAPSGGGLEVSYWLIP
jgi:protein involved in polysaccharide export with SLBB domain